MSVPYEKLFLIGKQEIAVMTFVLPPALVIAPKADEADATVDSLQAQQSYGPRGGGCSAGCK